MRTCISNYTLKTTKINNITIVHISDIHFSKPYNLKILENVSQTINKIKPNYICITGDIIDNNEVLDNNEQYKIIYDFFENLCKNSKVIVTLGNHEMKGKKYTISSYNEILNKLRKIPHLIVLDNDKYVDKNICFVGFNPSYEYYEVKGRNYKVFVNDFNKMNLKLDTKMYNILLIHTPKDIFKDCIYNNIEALKDFELILAGHTHGGMMPIKIKGHMGIISPGKRLFPKNVRGHIIRNNTHLIICSAIVRLSNCAKFLRHFNWVYASHINNINVSKQ